MLAEKTDLTLYIPLSNFVWNSIVFGYEGFQQKKKKFRNTIVTRRKNVYDVVIRTCHTDGIQRIYVS